MAEMVIKLKNEAAILRAFNEAPRELTRGIQLAVNRAGIFLAGKVKENITSGNGMWKPPIDSGAMRQGMNASFAPLQATIRPSSGTPYAAYVHEGTSRMRARPFFDITVESNGEEAVKFFQNEVDGILKSLARKIN